MKKVLILLIISSLVFGCKENASDDIQNVVKSPKESYVRNLQEAIEMAENALELFPFNDYSTRGSELKSLDLETGIKFVTSANTSTRMENNVDTLIYIFNLHKNKGFVAISAYKGTEPVIAITEEGSYDPSKPSENKAFDLMMEAAKTYVEQSICSNLETFPNTRAISYPAIYTIIDQVGNYLNIRWGQNDVEGTDCPNGIAGCANTAAAQLMSFHEVPQTININYPLNGDSLIINTYELNWEEMKKHFSKHTDDPALYFECPASAAAHTMITRLCRQLGELSNSTYDESSTSTDRSSIYNTFNTLGYETDVYNYNENQLVEILDEGRPIWMDGRTALNEGHAWLIDGYRYYLISERLGLDNSIIERYAYYNHVNWGWHGRDNGYFASGIFKTNSALIYDGSSNLTGYNFINSLHMVDIYPY